jgi:hypothetical protein
MTRDVQSTSLVSSRLTREEWLNNAVIIADAHIYATSGMRLNTAVRVSCGFPRGRGQSNKAIGQCWPTELSADQTAEIFISPTLDKGLDVLGVLVHELVHAIVGCVHGHKAPFKKVAVAAGLEGKMTSTTASMGLLAIMGGWLEQLGEYPHAALSMSGRKKQSTRLLKAYCAIDAIQEKPYTVRITQKWVTELGAPICPCHNRAMQVDGQDSNETEDES